MSQSQMVQALEGRRLLTFSTIINPPITEYAALPQQVRVAYLPTLTVKHLSDLSADIDWGDTTQSSARFDYNKHGGIDIIATHQYTQPGTFSISAHLFGISYVIFPPFRAPLPVDLGSVTNVVTVEPTPPKVAVTLSKSSEIELATFFNSQPRDTFTAKINWGDTGDKSAGKFVTSDGNWQLFAAHVYTKPGTYLVHAYVYPHVKGSTFKFSPYAFPTLITVV